MSMGLLTGQDRTQTDGTVYFYLQAKDSNKF